MFTEAEEEQLCEMFDLSDTELRSVLEALSYAFEQAAYHTIRPPVLTPLLVETGMDEPHASCVAEVWEDGAAGLVRNLREYTTTGSNTLTGSQYRLHLQMGDSTLTRLQHPCALFELSLGSPHGCGVKTASECGGGGGEAAKRTGGEKVAVEFNHAELYDFFLKLERIQEQIDALS